MTTSPPTAAPSDTPVRTKRAPRPRVAGTWYVVRDTRGVLRHTGITRKRAVAPYDTPLPKKLKTATNAGHYGAVVPLRRTTLWQFLVRRGWTCVREARPTTTPHAS